MIGVTPDITAVAVVRHGVLSLTSADGVTGEVAVLERMGGPVFDEAVTPPEGFVRVRVDAETGPSSDRRCGPRARHAVRTCPHGCLAGRGCRGVRRWPRQGRAPG